ncbi:putative extracellular serine carboxypeptidase [Venturia nashicola]|uniref:Putative extracellular serine carboxypeptidase n=1 Tax=Venturia nashicola TaxID=86259 RepID=A0A4Z1NXX2_9PEZI|nr:putative extracellular serine carboxypeptidase [Venturia nashicola]
MINRAMHPPKLSDSTDSHVQAALEKSRFSTFTQLIDHKNPSLGTFEQFYYYSSQYWGGPGSPILLFTPGESNVTDYETWPSNKTTTGVLAKKLGAAVVVVEHRYWGTSTPYTELSTENLQYLTLENSILDFVRFAQMVKLPFAPKGGANATTAPWVFMGGSYGGALAAWTESVASGTFWAYWGSSATVNAMDYWQYFVPIQQGMPKNCSADITRVVNALQNGPWLWQGNQFYSNEGFFSFCDTIEGVKSNGFPNATTISATLPSASGVGLQRALIGYSRWMNETFIPYFCDSYHHPEYAGKYNVACFDTYNPNTPYYTDWSLGNPFDRQWVWMTCNEPFGYWQDGAPPSHPSLVSRLVTREYWERQCGLFFPPSPSGKTYGLAAGKTFEALNAYTGGWFIDNSTRLLYVNGGFDPWKEATVSSEFRPGGPLKSTAKVPVHIVPGGFHTSDLFTKNGLANKGCQHVIDKGMAVVEAWVGEWKGRSGGGDNDNHDIR